MSEADPLVQRVDALLRRHQQRVEQIHAQSHAEQSLAPLPPLEALAEHPPADRLEPVHAQDGTAPAAVVETPPDAAAPALDPPIDTAEDIPVLTEVVDPEMLAAVAAPAEDLRGDALVLEIENAVMGKLLGELDRTLDQRLSRSITDLLEQVLHGMRAELSVSVRQMVRESVSAAIAKEIAERLRSE